MQAEGRRGGRNGGRPPLLSWPGYTNGGRPHDGRKRGRSFLRVETKKERKREKKSHKVSLLLATTTIHWRSGSSFSPAPSRLILIYLSGPRFNSFDVPCVVRARAWKSGAGGGEVETFSRRPCFRADTVCGQLVPPIQCPADGFLHYVEN